MPDILRIAGGQPTISLVVPVYNEEERLAESFQALVDFVAQYPQGSELIISDDGSEDATVALAHRLIKGAGAHAPVRVVTNPHRGKGATVRSGLERARGDFLGFCDVDLATPLHEVERLFALAMIGPGLAIGSRDVVTSHRIARESAAREFLGRVYNRLVRTVATPGIFDTQCGAKFASSVVWRNLLPLTRQNGFAWDVELVAVAKRLNFAVWEVGVEWSHDDRTRVRTLRDGFAMVVDVAAIWTNLRRLGSAVGDPHVIRELESLERPRRVERATPSLSSGGAPTLVEQVV